LRLRRRDSSATHRRLTTIHASGADHRQFLSLIHHTVLLN
jgi:hypothetical protein